MNSKSFSIAILLLFGDISAQELHLSDAYDLALKQEPKLSSLALHKSAIQEKVNQAQARFLPQVQSSLSWGRYEYDAEYLKKPVQENYTSYSVSASQALYRPDVWRSIDQAKANYAEANYQYQADAQKLGLDLTKAYFNVLRTERNLEQTQYQKEYYESKFKQLENMLTLGLTNKIDLLDAKVHRDRANTDWLVERKRHEVALRRLENYIGEPVLQLPKIDFSHIDFTQFNHDKAQTELKISQNPLLRASIAREESSLHDLAIREYQHHPKVDISLVRKETYTSDTVSHKYDNQAILQLTLPLYQGGATESQIREGEYLAKAEKKNIEYIQKETQLRFEELWAERDFTLETIHSLIESEKSAELFVHSVEKAQEAGLKSIVDVLEAKAKLFQIKRDLIDAGYDMINNELSLLDVVGELNVENMALLEKQLFSFKE